MTRRRAAVLIAVHVVMAVHIIQWLVQGTTLAPLEPSESMYTIELGVVNAGFVVFSLAILSTLVFGRFFCGWGCHIVALQDLCGHWMARLGVRPRPFRTRLPLYWALLLALYMFVWPTFKREVVFRLLASAQIPRPGWLADVASFPGLAGIRPEFIVEDYWKTFAPWYIAIPFLLVCGFATVYFLGNKAFCTYACPYGGFFAPLDRLSIGRIVVSDACNHCGHCTSVCTSNVRVHQEVRDFGQVMDPGCMKCLDCVSVCPNDALSFRFAKPTVLTPRRDSSPHTDRPAPDLARWEEVWVFCAGILIFVSLRQFLNVVPLLMAAGLAMIGAFSAWKLSRLCLDEHVRLQNLQLKLKGRLTPGGVVFAVGAAAFLAVSAWSGVVILSRYQADQFDLRVTTPYETVYSPGYTPDPAEKDLALSGLAWFKRSSSFSDGGFGWPLTPEQNVRSGWLAAVAGDLDASEAFLRRAIDQAMPSDAVLSGLARIRALRGDPPAKINDLLQDVLTKYPNQHAVRLALAQSKLELGDPAAAFSLLDHFLTIRHHRPTPLQMVLAAEVMLAAGKPDQAITLITQELSRHPKAAILHAGLGRMLFLTGKQVEGLEALKRATELDPTNIPFWQMLAEMLRATGDNAAAEQAESTLANLIKAQVNPK